MSRSIFYRYFLMVQSVLLLAMLCVAVFSFSFFGRYAIGSQSAFLTGRAERLAEMTQMVFQNESASAAEFLEFNMNTLSQSSGCTVSILNSHGNIYKETRYDADGVSASRFDAAVMEGVLSGKAYRYFGKLPEGKTTMLVVSAPIIYNETNLGAVAISVPVPALQSARKELMITMIWVYLISMLLSSAASFFMARYVTRPLRQMSRAAQEIGKGNFDVRVTADSSGELLELSHTFNRMTESLRNLDEMRTSFIANVSHELRTPMTTISGFVEGILDGTVPPEKEKEYLSIVLSESRRLSALVSRLLDASRLDDTEEIDEVPFDLTESVRVGILQFESTLTEKNISVSANFESERMMAKGDPDMIRQVITNLLDNAVKFTPPGGSIRVDIASNDARMVTSITNTGDGIAPEDLPFIWDRFYKTDRSRGENAHGVGLGLSLVRAIIKAHGETVEAKSVPGEYTTFTFTLKRAEE